MITNQESLEQARDQLERMEDVIAGLMSQADRMHPSQLALQLEGPLAMVEQLRTQIDEYLGIERARTVLRVQSTST